MPCSNLGLWSSVQATKTDACGASVGITIYGNSLSVGESLYTSALCTAPSELTTGFYSNGVVAFYYLGGFRYFTSCNCADEYCVDGTNFYDDTYEVAGTFNNEVYFEGSTWPYFIYYNLTNLQWCLSSSLGGVCDLFGPMGSSSPCPDLDSSLFYSGACQTTPITTDPCEDFNFEAIFDCFFVPVPEASPTSTPTPTPTPTPTQTNPCGGYSATISGIKVTPSPSTTPTPTPTQSPTIIRPCIFSGSAIFNGVSEKIICGDSKKFKDCFTGFDYYTTESVLDPYNNQLSEGFVYQVVINGTKTCAIFEGLVQNLSGIDNIQIILVVGDSASGACLYCPEETPIPVYNCLVVNSECGSEQVNAGPIINGRPSYTWTYPNLPLNNTYVYSIYWDPINVRWVAEETTTNLIGSYLPFDTITPIGAVGDWVDVTCGYPNDCTAINCLLSFASFNTIELPTICPSMTPTPMPTPTPTPNQCITSTWLITNNGPITQEVQVGDCNGNVIDVAATPGDSYWCSSFSPISNSTALVISFVDQNCVEDCCPIGGPLPRIGQSLVINGITLAGTGFGDITFTGPQTFSPACYSQTITVTDLIQGGATLLGNWSYTVTFNGLVNNVRIRLFDYTFKIDTVTGVLVSTESVQFSVNNGQPQMTVTECDACCYQIVGQSVEAFPLSGCIGNSSLPYHSGSGIFTIYTPSGFNSLTLSSNQLSYALGGIKFDICGFDVIA